MGNMIWSPIPLYGLYPFALFRVHSAPTRHSFLCWCFLNIHAFHQESPRRYLDLNTHHFSWILSIFLHFSSFRHWHVSLTNPHADNQRAWTSHFTLSFLPVLTSPFAWSCLGNTKDIEIISSAFASHFFFDIFFVFLLNSCLTQHLSVCSAQWRYKLNENIKNY